MSLSKFTVQKRNKRKLSPPLRRKMAPPAKCTQNHKNMKSGNVGLERECWGPQALGASGTVVSGSSNPVPLRRCQEAVEGFPLTWMESQHGKGPTQKCLQGSPQRATQGSLRLLATRLGNKRAAQQSCVLSPMGQSPGSISVMVHGLPATSFCGAVGRASVLFATTTTKIQKANC